MILLKDGSGIEEKECVGRSPQAWTAVDCAPAVLVSPGSAVDPAVDAGREVDESRGVSLSRSEGSLRAPAEAQTAGKHVEIGAERGRVGARL